MDSGRTTRRLNDSGLGSLQFVLASGLGLILFVLLANLVVVQYGRGALRSALDQGARVAAVTGSTAECESRVNSVLAELLGGRMGDEVTIDCEIDDALVVAQGIAIFQAWVPSVPGFLVEIRAEATLEGLP